MTCLFKQKSPDTNQPTNTQATNTTNQAHLLAQQQASKAKTNNQTKQRNKTIKQTKTQTKNKQASNQTITQRHNQPQKHTHNK